MADIQTQIRERAKELLESGAINYFIGWGETKYPGRTMPLFVVSPDDTDKLVFNEHCLALLGKYVLESQYEDGKVGLCARGCDSRAINRLIADRRLQREQVYLLGIPCTGMEQDGKPAEKCVHCTHRNPVTYDEMLGDPVPEQKTPDRFAAVEQLEQLSADERYDYWTGEFEQCIRCYACRNACPACNCIECYTDQYRTGWQGKQMNQVENQIYGLTRAYHIGDRCIECGECERVCPMHLSLMKLNRKLVKDVSELFGYEHSGVDTETVHALGTYTKDDLEEFM